MDDLIQLSFTEAQTEKKRKSPLSHRTYCVPGTLQKASHVLTHFILTTALQDKYYHLHFADKKNRLRVDK